ncbi:MAG: ABC transporter ATP-binding protein [Limnochordaceae bacterium]|nr:ABC transporter ATP-binding protein [Limnochordaceae bacterium]
MDALLAVEGLSKAFGRLQAVHDVSFAVAPREIRAVIGPNGAGKTTLFHLISGALRPDKGTVRFAGQDVTALPGHARVRLGLSRTFQVPNVFAGLSVRDNLRLGVEAAEGLSRYPWIGRGRREQVDERVEQLLARLRLDKKAERPVGELAHGDQRVVEIGLALSLGARLLLLDEPTAGMSDEETAATVRLIRELWEKEGVAVLFTEHDMRVVFEVAHRITVLHLGEVLAEGGPQEIAAHPAVQAAYLGSEAMGA